MIPALDEKSLRTVHNELTAFIKKIGNILTLISMLQHTKSGSLGHVHIDMHMY